MPSFEPGDVVRVPFPYTDRATRQHRPALVISEPRLQQEHGLVWVLMITSAENRGWGGDIGILNLLMAGLPAASVIRPTKMATIDARDAQRLGKISGRLRQHVLRHVLRNLASPAAN
ncbi:MAG TPA: type II toxin-antitoxin system PemK/MazF family toxin [Rudaea sp.]|jgi:mRNA interferase MazF|uniref:type II toxin-antitoxin system PemK/MazF family toxin n=1 Tax=Rudaea sp. TaxID=2136325 RepID=UPI002F922B97